MPPAHRLLVLLCLAGCLFIGWQLAARRATTQTTGRGDDSEGQVRILQKQVQMLQEQVLALEEQNRDLRRRAGDSTTTPETKGSPGQADPNPAGDDAAAGDRDSMLQQALAFLGREQEAPPRLIPVDEATMRSAINANLAGDGRDSWRMREAVWKSMGLIPRDSDLLASFEDMILENFPALFSDETPATLLVLEGTSAHLGQLVPVLGAMLEQGRSPWEDTEQGEDDALWLEGIARRLGLGLRARTTALLNSSPGAEAGSGEPAEPRYFRAPVAVRELFRLLPQAGMAALQQAAGSDATRRTADPNRAGMREAGEVLGMQPAWDGTWGDVLTRLLLQQFLPEETALQATHGLVGDRIVAFPDPERGDGLQLLWQSRWATIPEAGAFFDALETYYTNQLGEPENRDQAPRRSLSFVTAGEHLVEIVFASDRSDVTVILASNRDWKEALQTLSHELAP